MEFTQNDILEFSKLHAESVGCSANDIISVINYMVTTCGYTTEEVINKIKQSGGLNNE